MNVGVTIRNLREARGMSVQELADIADLHSTQIYKIETEKSIPSLPALDRICNAFKISLGEFFDTGSNELPVDIQQLIETSKKLPPEERKALNDYLKIRVAAVEPKLTEQNKEPKVVDFPVTKLEIEGRAAEDGNLDGSSEVSTQEELDLEEVGRQIEADEEYLRNNPKKK